MPFVSVPAIYDGEHIELLETPPVHGPYRVVVVFVEPAPEGMLASEASFWDSFGAWQDDRPVEATLREIHEARRSKVEPPEL